MEANLKKLYESHRFKVGRRTQIHVAQSSIFCKFQFGRSRGHFARMEALKKEIYRLNSVEKIYLLLQQEVKAYNSQAYRKTPPVLSLIPGFGTFNQGGLCQSIDESRYFQAVCVAANFVSLKDLDEPLWSEGDITCYAEVRETKEYGSEGTQPDSIPETTAFFSSSVRSTEAKVEVEFPEVEPSLEADSPEELFLPIARFGARAHEEKKHDSKENQSAPVSQTRSLVASSSSALHASGFFVNKPVLPPASSSSNTLTTSSSITH